MRAWMTLFSCTLVLSVSAAPDDSHIDKLYGRGAYYWETGDLRSAEKYWYQYLELVDRMNFGKKTLRDSMVRSFYLKVKEKLEISDPVSQIIPKQEFVVVQSTSTLSNVFQKKRLPKKTRLLNSPARSEEKLAKLLFHADREKRAGHFENAIRLYRLALQLDPGSAANAEALQELEKLVK